MAKLFVLCWAGNNMYVPSNLGHTTNSFEAAVMAQAAPVDEDDDGVVAHAVLGSDSGDSGDDVAEKLWSAAIQSGTIPAEDASAFPNYCAAGQRLQVGESHIMLCGKQASQRLSSGRATCCQIDQCVYNHGKLRFP